MYKTYDDYVNDSERCFIEYFLRDAYEYYGYSFHSYDGGEMDQERAEALIADFTTVNKYIRDSWVRYLTNKFTKKSGEPPTQEVTERAERTADEQIVRTSARRASNAQLLLRGLRFVNPAGQELHMIPKLELDPALLEQPLYH